jgi:uncharacterized protein (TIGR00255 family)
MTGYGEAELATDQGRLRVEVKSVNHRFFNASVRTPAGFDRLENDLTSWLRPFISRGHVHLVVSLDRDGGARDDLPVLDVERARHCATLLASLKDELGLSGEVDLISVARLGDVFRPAEPLARRPDIDTGAVREVVEEAVRGLVGFREAEGARLRHDMEERLRALASALECVERLAPQRLIRERDRLREAVRELSDQEDVDQDRLAKEIAYLAEKWDVNEEIVRFRSHLAHFRETFDVEGEPVGKRLSFVLQEMNREANTLGAKANDGAIARAAVAMKEEIERLREQVENVE